LLFFLALLPTELLAYPENLLAILVIFAIILFILGAFTTFSGFTSFS